MFKDKSAAFTEIYYSRPMYVNQRVLFLLMLLSELDRSSSSDDAKNF